MQTLLEFGDGRQWHLKPFKTQLLKWIGSKQRFAHEIVSHFPHRFGRYRQNAVGQVNLLHAAAATVLVGTDARLVHAGYERRSAGGTYWRRDKGAAEARTFPGEPIHGGGLDQLLAVAREVGRHIVYDEPQNIRAFGGLADPWQTDQPRQDKTDTAIHDRPFLWLVEAAWGELR